MKEQREFIALIRDHFVTDEKRFESIDETLKTIKNNHLYHVEKDMATHRELLKDLVVEVKSLHTKMDTNTSQTVANTTNIDWLKWGMMAVGGVMIAGLASLFFATIGKG